MNPYASLGIVSLSFGLWTMILSLMVLGITYYRRAFNRRHLIFFSLTLAIFFWFLGAGMEFLSMDSGLKIFWSQVLYIGSGSAATLWFIFIMSFTKYEEYLKPWVVLILLLIPIFVISMAFTNSWHGLLWTSITPVTNEPGSLLNFERGPIFYFNALYSYLLLLIGSISLLKSLQDADKGNRRIFYLLLTSGLIALISSLIYYLGFLPVLEIDLTPFGVSIAVGIIFLGVFTYDLLDIPQIAHDLLLKQSDNGVMVFDKQDRLIEFNPAASMLGINQDCIGKKQEEILEEFPAINSYLKGQSKSNIVFLEDLDLWLQLKYKNIMDKGMVLGSVLEFTDISAHKESLQALERSQHKNKAILQAIPDMMFIFNQEGTIVDFKSKDDDELILDPEEIIGTNISDIGFTPSLVALTLKKIQEALEKDETVKFQYHIPLQDKINYYEARLIKLNSSKVLSIVRNISELKEIENSLLKSKALYQTIFDNTGVPTGIFNREGYFTLINQKMEEFLNCSQDDLFKRKWMEFAHPEDLPFMLEYNRIRQEDPSKAPNNYETRIIDSQGQIHRCQLTVNHIPYQDEYIVSVVDITPLCEAQEKIEESEKKYREIFENVQDVFYQADLEGNILDISPSIYRYSGYHREELIGTNILRLYLNPLDRDQLLEYLQAHGEINDYETVLKNKEEELVYVSINAHYLTNKEGEIIGVEGTLRDVSERKKAQDEIEYRIEMENLLMDISKNFINLSSSKVDEGINQALKSIGEFIKVDRAYLIQLSNDDHFINTHEWTVTGISSQIDTLQYIKRSDYKYIWEELTKNGQVLINSIPDHPQLSRQEKEFLIDQGIQSLIGITLTRDGKIKGMVGFDSVVNKRVWSKENVNFLLILAEILNNLLEKKETEETMQATLEEREILLQEIHHRVKNNMQIISSLLNLQKDYEEEEKAKEVLIESQGRIKTMALLHEKLYQSGSLKQINFEEYLQDLIKNLFYSYGVKTHKIQAQLDVEDLEVNIETAIPLGLIVNELVTNSLNYAFPDGNGKICLRFYQENSKLNLIVADNGIGLPDNLDIDNNKSLGLKLVKSLSKQLDAELELDKSAGTCFHISFQELAYEDRL